MNLNLLNSIEEIESLYIPKLKGDGTDFNFDYDPFLLGNQTPIIFEFRKSLINCWECWRIYSFSMEDYEKEWIELKDYRKGDKLRFHHDRISKYISDFEFTMHIKTYLEKKTENIFEKFEERINEQNTDANQKILIKKFIKEIESSFNNLIDEDFNKYNKIIVSQLFKSYFHIIETIFNDYEDIFPVFMGGLKKKLEYVYKLYEKKLGFVNELDEFIYREHHKTFLEYEEKLFPDFLNTKKEWIKLKNDLVRYYLFLNEKEFFKAHFNKSHLKALNFLSNRYNIELIKQTDPNRIKNLTPKCGLFDFLRD